MRKNNYKWLLLLLLLPSYLQADASAIRFELEAPEIVHSGEEFTVSIKPEKITPAQARGASVSLRHGVASGPTKVIRLSAGDATDATYVVDSGGSAVLIAELPGGAAVSAEVRAIPGWLSLVPPLIAIGLALWLKTVIPSLFLGLWAGVMIQNGFTVSSFFSSALESFSVRIHGVMTDPDHVSIILFSCMIGGLVSIISRNGGMLGVINVVIQWANTARRGQLSVWFLGLCIFFDDYTNTMVVGNSVRSVTDKLKISRQKLAYLVDSTAAPVACVAVMTTWIGYEVSLIDAASAELEGFTESAYTVFLSSLAYSFYPFLAIFFVYLVASSGRDFGPMLKAEQQSFLNDGPPLAAANKSSAHDALNPMVGAELPTRALNAVIPILVLVFSCMAGLYVTGEGESIRDIMSTADAYKSLMWSSFAAVATAMFLTISQRLLSLEEVVEAWTQGALIMVAPMIILILAWALSDVTSILHTADYLVRLGGDSLTPASIPAWTFVLSAAAAFATGSSWGVMAIVLPLILPVAWAVLGADGAVAADSMHIIYSTVACVLAGSVWGDHCSPISDTTVLSSMASGCDHIEHVRTQIPYAMTVGAVALFGGIIPTAHGVPWWLAMTLCAISLMLILRILGKPAHESSQA
ncbi:MAG: Na+/H+ antiporter NhaC family protein [Pseudomonadales bacterium]